VLTAGQIVEGTWTKPSPEAPTQFLDATGAPIKLTPRPHLGVARTDRQRTITG